jgi:dTDP-4-dehydrorhamnose 3,5-epimerase
MKIQTGPMDGLIIITPNVYPDARGYFYECFHEARYQALGMPRMVQSNFSHSKRKVLRGLHYQLAHPQGKLVSVIRGEIWDVAVDIRRSSSTFGKWFGILLNTENHLQFYIPPGFAHGFCIISDEADVSYQCTDLYDPAGEQGIIWNDPQLNIDWPIQDPILSPKDKEYLSLNEKADDSLFQ